MNLNVQKLAAAFRDQTDSIMGLIYDHYAEFHSYDNPVAKRYLQELRKLADASGNGDEIMEAVNMLCCEYEQDSFVAGVKIGMKLLCELIV